MQRLFRSPKGCGLCPDGIIRFFDKKCLKNALYKIFFYQTKVVKNQILQLLCYLIFFDILHHYRVIVASQICSVSRKYCAVLRNKFFSFLCLRSFPFCCFPLRGSAPLQSGLACLSPVCWSTLRCGWRGLAATFSSVLVRWFPCCRSFGIFWASPAPLACWGGWGFAPCVRVFQLRCCLLGLQVGFPCCLFLTSVGVLLAKVSPEFVGYEGGFGCPSWFFILFRCLMVHLLFLELGWFLVTRWWLLLRLLVLVSSDARSHILDAFASSSTPFYGSWMVLAPGFSCALPWVRPSRFPCWLLARDT